MSDLMMGRALVWESWVLVLALFHSLHVTFVFLSLGFFYLQNEALGSYFSQPHGYFGEQRRDEHFCEL